MKKIVFILFIFIGILYPQRKLDLNTSLQIALGESYNILAAQLNLESSERNLEATQLGLRTAIDLEFDLPRYSRTLSSQFDPTIGKEKFFTIGSTVIESRISLSQPIIFSNGNFSLIGSLFGRDQFGGDKSASRDYYSNLVFRFRQPLFTFNNLKANLTKAEINLEKAQRNYDKSKADIIYSVTANFFQLYQLKKNMEIVEEKVSQTESAYNTAVNKFKAGLIAEVDALQLEVDLVSAKNDLLTAQRRYEEEKNNFKQLIGLSLSENIEIDAKIDFKVIDVNLDYAKSLALKNRPDLLNSKSDITLSEISFDEIDARGRIRADLTANYGINKNDEEFKYLFKDLAENQSVTFTLSIPIWNWGKNKRETESALANLNLSKLDYEYQLQSVEKEIITAVNKINSARARVEVLSKSVEVAQKTYNISLERFNSGAINSFELSQMQLRLTTAKLNSLSALIDYKVAIADLERKTLHKFDN